MARETYSYYIYSSSNEPDEKIGKLVNLVKDINFLWATEDDAAECLYHSRITTKSDITYGIRYFSIKLENNDKDQLIRDCIAFSRRLEAPPIKEISLPPSSLKLYLVHEEWEHIDENRQSSSEVFPTKEAAFTYVEGELKEWDKKYYDPEGENLDKRLAKDGKKRPMWEWSRTTSEYEHCYDIYVTEVSLEIPMNLL